MSFTLEQILTAPAAFALTSASPLQRAICRVADGLPLGELAAEPTVRAAVGDLDGLPVGERPAELYLLSGIRTGKSLFAAALAVRAALTADVSRMGAGDLARVSVVSLRVDLADVVLSHVTGHLLARPALRGLLVDEPTADAVTLRHPSGRPIEIKIVAGARAGATLVARWSAGVIFDEFPRMIGADDGVVNFPDARRAVLGRLLPGAQLVGIGSPWAPFGPAYELVQERWGRPSRDVVVIRAPAPAMNPSWWTRKRCEELRRRDPQTHRTDVLAEFADAESGLLTADEVEKATRRAPLDVPPVQGAGYAAAMDPATRGNAWTLAIATRTTNPDRRVVVLARQWLPQYGAPLSPAVVLGELAALCEPYGVTEVHTDGWSADAIRDLAAARGLSIVDRSLSPSEKWDLYTSLATHAREGALEVPADPVLRSDLLGVRKRVTQEGARIVLPKTSDGRHCDYAPALVLAVKHAEGACGDLSVGHAGARRWASEATTHGRRRMSAERRW